MEIISGGFVDLVGTIGSGSTALMRGFADRPLHRPRSVDQKIKVLHENKQYREMEKMGSGGGNLNFRSGRYHAHRVVVQCSCPEW